MAKQFTTHKFPKQMSREKVRKIWTETFTTETVIEKIPFKEYLVAAFITNAVVAIVVAALSYSKNLPPQVPLLYGEPEGEGQLVVNWLLATPALVSLLFIVINTALAYRLKDEFLKKVIVIALIALTFLSTVTTIRVILLVGRL